MIIIKHVAIIFGILVFSLSQVVALTLPEDRTALWKGNVGVKGGIPYRTAICATLSPGVTSGQINQALNNCQSDQVVFLGAGTYNLTETIYVPKYVTLRGVSQTSTILTFTENLTSNIRVFGGYTDDSEARIRILSGYEKGSNRLVLENSSGISAGNFVIISELNDANIPVTITNANGTCTYCGLSGSNGERARLQISEVVGISNNILTISPPLFFSLSELNKPQINKTPNYTQYAGIENLTVKNNGNDFGGMLRKGIEFQGAANCWVKNVKLENAGKRGVDLYLDVFRNEIRECHFKGAIDATSSDNYAFQIVAGTGNLVENNIFDTTPNGIVNVSSTGNVYAYNYYTGVHRLQNMKSWFWPDSWAHGAHNSYNLWEGNDQTALEWDFYWGSNSHNMAYRNRFHGKDNTIEYDSFLQQVGAIIVYTNNNYMSAVGNVLGTDGFQDSYEGKVEYANTKSVWITIRESSGVASEKVYNTMFRHMNYDYFTKNITKCDANGEPGCLEGSNDAELPASLYLSEKPFWWGSELWPPIGPDVTGYVSDIPAKTRYDSGEIDATSVEKKGAERLALSVNVINNSRVIYHVPDFAHVELNLHDVKGNLLQQLVNERKQAGIHVATLNFSELPIGVYPLTLSIDKKNQEAGIVKILYSKSRN